MVKHVFSLMRRVSPTALSGWLAFAVGLWVREPFALKLALMSVARVLPQGPQFCVTVDERQGATQWATRSTPKASTDRLDLTRATEANMSPIWGLSLATGLTRLLTDPGEVVGTVPFDGVTHTVERVTDEVRCAAISAMVWSDDVLIAEILNVWVYVDTETGRPKRIPAEVIETFDPANFI